jgi:hypothetical protein
MMIPNTETLHRLFEFTGALAVVTGAMAWWRRGSEEEDATVSEAADTVLSALSDADTVNKIDYLTDKNLRDQVTLEQAVEMNEERNLRRWGWGRN